MSKAYRELRNSVLDLTKAYESHTPMTSNPTYWHGYVAGLRNVVKDLRGRLYEQEAALPENVAEFEVDSVKMLRESLALAQGTLGYGFGHTEYGRSHMNRLQGLIDQLDAMRPIDNDGNHGNLHTERCGCEDREPFPQGL